MRPSGWRREDGNMVHGQEPRSPRGTIRAPSRSTATRTASGGHGTSETSRPAARTSAALGLKDETTGPKSTHLADVAVQRRAIGGHSVPNRQISDEPAAARYDRRPLAVVVGKHAEGIVEAIVGRQDRLTDHG